METPASLPSRKLTLGRGWLLPSSLVALILAGSYLPSHGVMGLVSIAAATIAALGLVAASFAAPRLIRGVVTGRRGNLPLIGSDSVADAGPTSSPRRRVVAILLGAGASGLGTAAFALLLTGTDPLSAGHAVMVVALYANVALLLSNITPIPAWPGWQLVLALIESRGTIAEERVDRALPIARWIVTAEGAAVGVLAVATSDLMLLVLAVLLVWQGWMMTAVARADDVIHRFLTARRLGELARDLSLTAGPDEPALQAGGRQPSDRALVAVMDGDGLLGAIGPRQMAAVSPAQQQIRCADVMIPIDQIELLRPEAAAANALPQLDRLGFALVVGDGRLRYVEVHDLVQRIQMSAAVAQAARGEESTSRQTRKGPREGGSP